MDEKELRKKYNIWKTADIKGSTEIKEDNEWLSLQQVMYIIENLTKHNSSSKKDCFTCNNCGHQLICKYVGKLNTESCDYWISSPS